MKSLSLSARMILLQKSKTNQVHHFGMSEKKEQKSRLEPVGSKIPWENDFFPRGPVSVRT